MPGQCKGHISTMSSLLHKIVANAASSIRLATLRHICLQVTSPVLWEATMKTLLEKGLENSYEIGPNKVIAGILKRIDKKHSIQNVQV